MSNLYFDTHTGSPNLRLITLSTFIITGFYINAFLLSFGYVRDDSMSPLLRPAGIPFSDTVFYRKFMGPKEKLQDKIVAVRDPFKENHIVFRRVIAEENQWVQRADDGGIIKIPKGHVWIEQENENSPRVMDSLADEIGGPVSKKFVIGPATSIVWPIWRRAKFTEIDKFRRLIPQERGRLHSRVYSNEEIFKKYGIR